MKPILLFDANIFGTIPYEDLKEFIQKSQNFLTDDVVKELLEGQRKHANHDEFSKKLNLVFNEQNGLKNEFALLVSHVPIDLEDVIENTKKTYDLKRDPNICSAHHLWLRSIICPTLISNMNRTVNSLLTWQLRNKEVDYNNSNWQNIKNKVKLNEIKKADPYFCDSNIRAKRLFKTWNKGDVDIRDGKYKVSDSRLIAHAMDLMFAYGMSVNILTSDYDVIDLQKNLFESFIDSYAIYEVLKKKLKYEELTSKRETIIVPIAEFKDVYDESVEKAEKTKECIELIVWFYNRDTRTYELSENYLPKWLHEFAKNYKGNIDCYALRKEQYEQYYIQYVWEPQYEEGNIKFMAWRRDTNGIADVMQPLKCKIMCTYEMEEINNPNNMGGFIKSIEN